MSVAFFLREADRSSQQDPELPFGMTLQIWRLRDHATLSSWPLDPLRVAVTIQDQLGLFDDDRYTELTLWCDTTRVHRLIVTPAWFRFPFMSPRDLQIGDVWTAPDALRQQLAQAAINEAHRRFAGDGASFWYVTDGDNAASAALAKSCGYQLVAMGRRTRPAGTPVLGQYVIEQLI